MFPLLERLLGMRVFFLFLLLFSILLLITDMTLIFIPFYLLCCFFSRMINFPLWSALRWSPQRALFVSFFDIALLNNSRFPL